MILKFDLSSRTEEDIHDDDEDGVDGHDNDEYVNVTIARGLPGYIRIHSCKRRKN